MGSFKKHTMGTDLFIYVVLNIQYQMLTITFKNVSTSSTRLM